MGGMTVNLVINADARVRTNLLRSLNFPTITENLDPRATRNFIKRQFIKSRAVWL